MAKKTRGGVLVHDGLSIDKRSYSKVSATSAMSKKSIHVHSDYDFAPVIFETSGALNKEGETVLKQIIRFASKREGTTHTIFASRAWARLSCCTTCT